jgi:hypothetical protein
VSGSAREEPEEHQEGDLVVANEFTSVRLRKVQTRNGEVLEIKSLRVEHAIRLDALVLESLTWRSLEDIAQGLETPFGPDHDEVAGEP